MVEFVNDFGTPYFLHPALIKGFAFLEGPVFREYESRFWRRQWMFLQVIYPGEDVRLLKSPDFITSYQIINGMLSSNTKEKAEYWIDIPGRRFIPVKRWGFRRNMRRLVEEVSPNLADKIGQTGYRYKDLVSIIQEYDLMMRQGTRRLLIQCLVLGS